MDKRTKSTGLMVVVWALIVLLSFGCRTKPPTQDRVYPEAGLMPDTGGMAFKCQAGQPTKTVIEVPPDRGGEVRITLSWEGSAEQLQAGLYSEKGDELLVETAGSSPIQLEHDVSKTTHRQQLLLVTVCKAGTAEGVIEIHTPAVQKDRPVTGTNLDKGPLRTIKPPDLHEKGKAVRQPEPTVVKKAATDPIEISRETSGTKAPPGDSNEPRPVRRKLPKEPSVSQEGRYAVVRVQLLNDKVSVISATVLEGRLVMSDVVAGDLLYEVTDGRSTYAVGTFPDPRYSRVYLPDGSVRQGTFPDRPAMFKVLVPGRALTSRILPNLVINVYSIPGTSRLTKVDPETFAKVRGNAKLLANTPPGMIEKSMTGIVEP